MIDHRHTHHTTTAPLMTSHEWRFGEMSAALLLPHLQQQLMTCDAFMHWQLIWLNNDGQPIIALAPKVAWSVYLSVQSDIQLPDSDINAELGTGDYIVATTYRGHAHPVVMQMGYDAWQQQLIAYSQQQLGALTSTENQAQKDESSLRYTRGLMGFIGYDVAAAALSPHTMIGQAEDQPLAFMGDYDVYLTQGADKQRWVLCDARTNTDKDSELWFGDLIDHLNQLDGKLSATVEAPRLPEVVLDAAWMPSDYQHAFARTQDYLYQGDCYQINLTQLWQGHLPVKDMTTQVLLDYLPALDANTQAPFSGYLGLQHPLSAETLTFELLSCSPELFFTFVRDKRYDNPLIRTKPIKGTRPRGATAEQDNALQQELIDSEKDRAENVMIVDLLRNDLGRFAKTGSVKVPHLFAIESFSNVHHMVSTITAELKPDAHSLAVLFGSLPAGSITGTPKKRAVEIISELEAAPRGAYCGTMGYMNFDGSGQWNVLIRTLQAQTHQDKDEPNRQVSLWAGGGITVASEVEAEYQECLDKVGNLLKVLAQKA